MHLPTCQDGVENRDKVYTKFTQGSLFTLIHNPFPTSFLVAPDDSQ